MYIPVEVAYGVLIAQSAVIYLLIGAVVGGGLAARFYRVDPHLLIGFSLSLWPAVLVIGLVIVLFWPFFILARKIGRF